MTACVNRKHTKKVAAVVTASLVGALSLGVAPVAAMAEGTGIETLAASWATGATITRAHDGNSGAVSNPNQATFPAGSTKYLVPTEVTNSFGDSTEIDGTYTVNYYQKVSGTDTLVASTTNGSVPAPAGYFTASTTKGTYYVEVVKGSES